MKRFLRGMALGLMSAAIMLCCACLKSSPSATIQNTQVAGPIQVVVVSGSNYDMGVQYGEQAATQIASNRDQVWRLLNTQVVDSNGKPLSTAVINKDLQVWDYYIGKYDPKLQDWMHGISQGAANKGYTVSYNDLLAVLLYLQELWARPAAPYPAETGVTALLQQKANTVLAHMSHKRTNTKAMASCTSFVANGTATGGVPMESQTLGADTAVTNYLIIVAYPTEGSPFISLTQAGRVANNSGMNSRYAWNMTAAVTDPTQACASRWGLSSEAYFHYLDQYATAPADAVNYINATPVAGVTGNFMFADNTGEVFGYEVGACGGVRLDPGNYGGTGFVAHTNDYISSTMSPYNLSATYFPDTFIRYATILKELQTAASGTVGLNFAENAWVSNSWFDATHNQWNTVPVPNSSTDTNTCNVPGNICEGGLAQVIQFPAQSTTYLQFGNPQGTSITNYWPSSSSSSPVPNISPLPTGQYTKWQLVNSADQMGSLASQDASTMISTATTALASKSSSLDATTLASLQNLLQQANQALLLGTQTASSAQTVTGTKTQMSMLGIAFTNFATAQIDAQTVSSQLSAK